MAERTTQHGEKLEVKNKLAQHQNIKAAAFKKNIRKTQPHKHDNYFEIIYLSKGAGFHFIDHFRFPVQPPVLFFVRKEQVHHWDLSLEPDGYVVIVKKAFIEKTLDQELKSLFTRLSSLKTLSLSANQQLELLFALLSQECENTATQSFTTTEGLLKALLSKILEVASPTLNSTETGPDLYQGFLALLNREESVKNKVAYYADLLHTSPQNLNAVCQKTVQQTASEVLADFLLSEAKRLLIYTSKTVSQIALELQFSDASHFVKYFKKATKLTPLQFRQAS